MDKPSKDRICAVSLDWVTGECATEFFENVRVASDDWLLLADRVRGPATSVLPNEFLAEDEGKVIQSKEDAGLLGVWVRFGPGRRHATKMDARLALSVRLLARGAACATAATKRCAKLKRELAECLRSREAKNG